MTKKQIEDLAKSSKSFNELTNNLFGKTDGNSWRKTRKIVDEFQVDVSHFKIPKYTKEILEEAVKVSTSMREVTSYLKLKIGGSSQSFIARRIKEFGISCDHFKKRLPFFVSTTRKTWQEILVERFDGTRTAPYILRRSLVESGRECKCEVGDCPVEREWLGKPIIIQIHHKDGNVLNNTPKNLMFVCPNCHTQTENWCNTSK